MSTGSPPDRGGRAAVRGFIIQALVALLESLKEPRDWLTVEVEPAVDSEKVDILWKKVDQTSRATQVKHSANPIGTASAEAWAADLRGTFSADDYELILCGFPATTFAGTAEVGGVRVTWQPGDLSTLREIAAFRLQTFVQAQGVHLPPQMAEDAVDYVAGRLLRGALDRERWTPTSFVEAVREVLFGLVNREARIVPDSTFDRAQSRALLVGVVRQQLVGSDAVTSADGRGDLPPFVVPRVRIRRAQLKDRPGGPEPERSDSDDRSGRGSRSRRVTRASSEHTEDLDSWLTQTPRSYITGDVGQGKSTLLRRIALALLEEHELFPKLASMHSDRVPLVLFFPSWVAAHRDRRLAPEAIVEELLSAGGANELVPFVRPALRERRVLLLIDGLDETNDAPAAGDAIRAIETWARDDVPVVLAGRGAAAVLPFVGQGWKRGEIAPLDPSQQRELLLLVSRRDRSEGTEVDGFLGELGDVPALRRLAEVPLFLRHLFERWRTGKPLPRSRMQALEGILDEILTAHPRRRASTHGRAVEPPPPLELDHVRSFLAEFALRLQWTGRTTASPSEARRCWARRAQDVAEDLGVAAPDASWAGDAIRWCTDSAGVIGVFPNGELGFRHRSLQEKLAADALARAGSEDVAVALRQHAENRWWTEVWSLLAMSVTTADTFASALAQEREQRPEAFHLDLVLLDCAAESAHLSEDARRGIVEAAALAVERQPWLPHRAALIERLGWTVASRPDAEALQPKGWFPGRITWVRSVYEAMAEWPREPATQAALWEGVGLGGADDRLAAMRSFTALGGWGSLSVQSARSPVVDPVEQAVLWAGQWSADGPGVTDMDEVRRAFSSGVPEWRVVAAAALVRAGDGDPAVRDTLLWLTDERLLLDRAFRDLLGETIIAGWAGDPVVADRLLPTCVERWHPYEPHEIRADHELAEEILLTGWLQHPKVVDWCVGVLGSRTSPDGFRCRDWASILADQELPPPVSEAAETFLVGWGSHDRERAQLARRLPTQRIKRVLCRDAREGHYPFWAMKALLDVWGRTDPDVDAVVRDVIEGPAERRALLAMELARMVPDSGERLRHLMECIPAADGWCLWRVADAIADLDEVSNSVLELLLARFTPHRLDLGTPVQFFRRWGHRPLVRAHVLGLFDEPDPPWSSLAAIGALDADVRKRVRDAIPRLDPEGRRIYVDTLARAGIGAHGVLARWTVECDPAARSRAAQACVRANGLRIEEHRFLVSEMTARGALDSRSRPEAAVTAALTAGKVALFTDAVDASGKRVRLPSASHGDEAPALWEEVVRMWPELDRLLGADVWERLGASRHANYGIPDVAESIAPYADRSPDASDALLALVDRWATAVDGAGRVPGVRSDEPSPKLEPNMLAFLARVRPGSRVLRDAGLFALESHSWPLVIAGASLIADNFGDDDGIRKWFAERPRSEHALAVAALAGWTGPDVEAAAAYRSDDWSVLGWAAAVALGEPSEIARFLEDWSSYPQDRNPHAARGAAMVLRRRASRDEGLIALLSARAIASSNPSHQATLVSALTGFDLSADTRRWAIRRLRELCACPIAVVGFDALENRFRPLMEIFAALVWDAPEG